MAAFWVVHCAALIAGDAEHLKGKLAHLPTQRRRKSTATRTGSQPRSAERTEALRISGSKGRMPIRPAAVAGPTQTGRED
jgi:hypothetical protein